jgi:hypothetical protein
MRDANAQGWADLDFAYLLQRYPLLNLLTGADRVGSYAAWSPEKRQRTIFTTNR